MQRAKSEGAALPSQVLGATYRRPTFLLFQDLRDSKKDFPCWEPLRIPPGSIIFQLIWTLEKLRSMGELFGYWLTNWLTLQVPTSGNMRQRSCLEQATSHVGVSLCFLFLALKRIRCLACVSLLLMQQIISHYQPNGVLYISRAEGYYILL